MRLPAELIGVSRICAVSLILLANRAVYAQITDAANGNSSEDSEIVEIEADGSLDDTTGSLDVVATDHAPHLPEEKSTSFGEAPRGVIGLETAAAVVSGVVDDPARMFQSLSLNPASIASLKDQGRPIAVGERANIVVFDPRHEWTPDGFVSRSSNRPYTGHPLKGPSLPTVHHGKIVYSLVGAA